MPLEHEFPFADPRENPGYLLWQVTMQWQRAMGQALAPLELTHTQFVLLAALRWLSLPEGAVVTKSDVARHAGVDRMMASKVIRGLAKRGLIAQAPHPTSGRAQMIELTETGLAGFRAALRVVGAVDATYFGEDAGAAVELLARLEAANGSG